MTPSTQQAAVSLLRTADLVRRSVAVVLDPYAITPQQFNVLRILRGAGEAGLPTLEIAERMVEQTPGITRLLDRLEAKQLVSRQRCPKDRRRVYCRITPAGLALLESLDQPIRDAENEGLSGLSPAQLEQLLSLLERIRRSQ
jgi:DNA-binding MarR family transcriptional regulator